MSWLYERYTKVSKENGTILVQKNFGQWRVLVKDAVQTSPYTATMFTDAFKRVSAKVGPHQIRTALMVGLGGGSAIKPLHTTFADCTLTAIECDSEMIAIAQDLNLYKPFPFPTIIHADARDAVSRMHERFDLIILDIFCPQNPLPPSVSKTFLQAAQKLLQPDGLLMANVSGQAAQLKEIRGVFDYSETWKFRYNNLGMFWN
jgi:spermidine synthase